METQTLNKKVCVITGASSGLGESLAREFAERGGIVYFAARRLKQLETIASDLRAKGYDAMPYELDVTDPMRVKECAGHIVEMQGRIDVWVNNAGSEQKRDILSLDADALYDITAVNYFGLVFGTQEAAKQMKLTQTGDIVQILSTSAFTPRQNESAYCAAKAAAYLFSQSAQQEFKPHGIRVINVLPGGMNTEFFKKAGLTLPPQAMETADVATLIADALETPRNINPELRIYRNG